MPTAPAVACRCGELDCKKHDRRGNRQDADRFRGTASARGYGRRWSDKLQPMILARDPLCRDPFKRGCVQPSRIGDHIIPKAQGGTDAMDNLQGLCVECHNAKTVLEQSVRFASGCPCDIHTRVGLLADGTLMATCSDHAAQHARPIAEWPIMMASGKGKGGSFF